MKIIFYANYFNHVFDKLLHVAKFRDGNVMACLGKVDVMRSWKNS